MIAGQVEPSKAWQIDHRQRHAFDLIKNADCNWHVFASSRAGRHDHELSWVAYACAGVVKVLGVSFAVASARRQRARPWPRSASAAPRPASSATTPPASSSLAVAMRELGAGAVLRLPRRPVHRQCAVDR